jgi:hypothetical protein
MSSRILLTCWSLPLDLENGGIALLHTSGLHRGTWQKILHIVRTSYPKQGHFSYLSSLNKFCNVNLIYEEFTKDFMYRAVYVNSSFKGTVM